MWSNVIVETGADELPPGRWKQAVTLANHDLYMFGGKAGTINFKDFWKLELRGGRWTKLSSENPPPALHEQTIVHHNGSLYMFGGETSLNNQTPLWIYSIQENTWRKLECSDCKAPLGRRGHIAGVYSGHMLVHGGYRDLKGSLGDLWGFHFETESWHLFYRYIPPAWYNTLPSARHNHAGIVHAGQLYIYGGMCNLDEKADFWKFDIGNRCWTQLKCKPSPGPLRSPVMAKALGSMFLIGGERNGKPVEDFWKFSFETESWDRITFHGLKPSPRHFPAILMLPAIIKIRSSSSDDGCYWWDYAATPGGSHPSDEEFKPKSVQRRTSFGLNNGNYQVLPTRVDECGLDDFDSDSGPKRSESSNCFKTNYVPMSSGRVQKSSSVRFTDFKQISNSTSDYSSMETLEELKRVGFENPNYAGPQEFIEMDTLSEQPGPGPSPSRYEVTTPNYLLVIGGFESQNSHIFNKELPIWRLRVSHELFNTTNET